jgi:Reverse transcriptase (RNA-dependent DNA polymerase)
MLLIPETPEYRDAFEVLLSAILFWLYRYRLSRYFETISLTTRVNNRLTWYLENNNILTELESGFRRGRRTTDQLVRLESFVREAFVRGKHAISVFFDMEKAYNTTWKYGILQDLQNTGLGGCLPTFVFNFLSNCKFNIRVGP